MFRTEGIWGGLREYPETVDFGQDWELWTRVPPAYQLHNLAEKLVSVRQHSGQFGLNPRVRRETQDITRVVPSRVLGDGGSSPEWLTSLESLPRWSGLDRSGDPARLYRTIQTLLRRFCAVFSTAATDPQVSRYLAVRYLRVLNSCRPWNLALALRCIRLLAGYLTLSELMVHLLKWPARLFRLGLLRDWLFSLPGLRHLSRIRGHQLDAVPRQIKISRR